MSQSLYNFEVLKLQFFALSSPYPQCCHYPYPRPHGITVKTVAIRAVLPRYLRYSRCTDRRAALPLRAALEYIAPRQVCVALKMNVA